MSSAKSHINKVKLVRGILDACGIEDVMISQYDTPNGTAIDFATRNEKMLLLAVLMLDESDATSGLYSVSVDIEAE